MFLVDVSVSDDDEIVVEIDSDGSVDIDACCALTRFIEERLPRDEEDYALEVGSSGLTSPFKCLRQYRKNIGREVEVLAAGRKLVGTLLEVTDEGISLELPAKGRKQPAETLSLAFADIKYAKYNLKFK